MLETIREYALEQLAESGEEQNVRERHAHYFLKFAERAEPELQGATPHSRSHYEPWLELARKRLGPDAFALAWEQGKALTIEDAIALALEEPPSESPPTASTHAAPSPMRSVPTTVYKPGSDLTKREIEVLRLVTVGLSNPEIAMHLTLSVLTVQTHMHSIFSKINVKTRAAAVRFVFEHNLS